MTFRNKLEKLCQENGLSQQEAESVLKACVTESDEDMNRRWDHNASDYPPQMLAVLWMITRRNALSWINANKPEHWAKAMFE